VPRKPPTSWRAIKIPSTLHELVEKHYRDLGYVSLANFVAEAVRELLEKHGIILKARGREWHDHTDREKR